MSPLLVFEQKLVEIWEPSSWEDTTVLLAVSGGADSVALLRAMAAVKRTGEGRLIAAHLNHQLRGEEAEADEAFVVELCRELHVPCEVGRVTLSNCGLPKARPKNNFGICFSAPHPNPLPGVPGRGSYSSAEPKGWEGEAPAEPQVASGSAGASPSQPGVPARRLGSLEAAARAARYGFLTETAGRVGARYVVTAHTADDQAETILHRIVRGTGIAGLAGMARTRPLSAATTLIRPLLGFRRVEVLEYLDALAQPYRQDSSNTDPQFTRNRIRHELLPHLAAEFNAGVVAALLRLGTLAGESQAVVGHLVEELAEPCVICETSGAVRIVISHLADQPAYVVRELLKWIWRRQGWPLQAMGFSQWEQLAAMVQCGLAAQRGMGLTPNSPGGQSPPYSERGKRVLPGNVVVEWADGELRLVRPLALR
ncbi:MAG: tRNA lysidine(34) synthetase TilS [Planctomycetota bacterium]|nr:tRNA lysidine(34) synthetase TilS [Planctomycetota bacterium]